MKTPGFMIQPYSQKELAAYYRCSTKTFRRWLLHLELNLGRSVRRCYSSRQVRVIVEHLCVVILYQPDLAVYVQVSQPVGEFLEIEEQKFSFLLHLK